MRHVEAERPRIWLWRRCETESNAWEVRGSAAAMPRRRESRVEAATCSRAAVPGRRRVAEEAVLIKVIETSRTFLIIRTGPFSALVCFPFISHRRIHFSTQKIRGLENRGGHMLLIRRQSAWMRNRDGTCNKARRGKQ